MTSTFLCIALLLQITIDSLGVWGSVGQHPSRLDSDDAVLTADQETSIKATLRRMDHVWQCAFADPGGEWLDAVQFKRISLSDKRETILVEAGPGCARGGQGANGAMWVVLLATDGKAKVLASPADDFNGWIYSVQASTSKGYKDIVVAWHINAREATLSYFRFDGTRYRVLSGATIRWDDSDRAIITPADKNSH